MSFLQFIEFNGYQLGFMKNPFNDEYGVCIDFKDLFPDGNEVNKDILNSAKDMLLNMDEILAVKLFSDNFEQNLLQGHSWKVALYNTEFYKLAQYKEYAEIILESITCPIEIRSIAIKFLDALDGKYPDELKNKKRLVIRKNKTQPKRCVNEK